MVEKPYDWDNGAKLDEHSGRKHKILREYFHQYLMVRCQNPAQTKFRLAVVDGFSGAGRYDCGSPGSPIIFIEELTRAVEAVNMRRVAQGLKASVEIECLLIFNDALPSVTERLKDFAVPLVAEAKETCPNLRLTVVYLSDSFERSYPAIKDIIGRHRFRNILFNLDQCGHSKVERSTLVDIMTSTPSAEIFYTFAIKSLLTYLSRIDPKRMARQVRSLGIEPAEFRTSDVLVTNKAWMGTAERIVFDEFQGVSPFVSPFSITNPEGWRYWLIHFANNYRARQVYNDVLHGNGTQAHFGRSGLNMLAYDPSHEGSLYLFESGDRANARDQLLEDIPRLIADYGDVMNVAEFYEAAYNFTPAHKDDIHAAMFDSADLEIFTDGGGRRRKANTIVVTDTVKLKSQTSFFSILFEPDKPHGSGKLIK